MHTTNSEHAFDFSVSDMVFVIHRQTDDSWKIGTSSSPGHYILAVSTGGEAVYRINNENHIIRKGDVLFLQPNILRNANTSSEEPWRFYSAAFHLHYYDPGVADALNIIPTVTRNLHTSLSANFRSVYDAWNLKRPGFQLFCRSQIEQMLYLLIENSVSDAVKLPHYHTMEYIKNHIAEHYAEFLTVEQLATLANLSPSYFRALFRKHTGMSVIQYQHTIKINRACDLLRSGSCNVTEAAFAVGFKDIYYFSRLFRKITGMTPSDYRKL